MRTDGTQLSGEAVGALRAAAADAFGPDSIPEAPRFYKSRVKNAQEAHEAIRPTRPGLRPSALPAGIGGDARRLYDLIWRRALACQMANARVQQLAVDVATPSGDLALRASGSVVLFPGYLAAQDGGGGSGRGGAAAAPRWRLGERRAAGNAAPEAANRGPPRAGGRPAGGAAAPW